MKREGLIKLIDDLLYKYRTSFGVDIRQKVGEYVDEYLSTLPNDEIKCSICEDDKWVISDDEMRCEPCPACGCGEKYKSLPDEKEACEHKGTTVYTRNGEWKCAICRKTK